MNSGRILGRGRVLGSGNAATPSQTAAAALAAAKTSQQQQQLQSNDSSSKAAAVATVNGNGNSKHFSPSSDSSTSLTSQLSGSTVAAQDLASNVSLGLVDHAAAASASSKLICPICNEQMVTLLQLNRHLDDVHQNLEEVEQDEVKNWFQAQMSKAKKFQPLAVLNQKFKGLDVFESNDSPSPNLGPRPLPATGPSTPEPTTVLPSRPVEEPDEMVTRTHWQRPGYGDSCSDPLCGKRLGGTNGSVNCRKCGKLFCEEHTMYQMKLSRAAQHEPARGVWCRVCETCYKSREGYNDNKGLERDHINEFTAIRRKTVDKQTLEISRLEKRLTKLTQILANPPPPSADSIGAGSLLWSLGNSAKSQTRALEQSVISWEDDASVLKCPFCQQEFSNYSFRRHHCRLCGRVVCSDPKTVCSSQVGLNVAAPTTAEKSQRQVGVDIRMCKDCKHTLFSKADFDREMQVKPADQRSYENLAQFQRGIRLLLPKFQRLLTALQNPDNPPTQSQISEATKVRKRLTDSFIQYESAARRIRDLSSPYPTQIRLQKAVYQQAYSFLHLHMLPLKALPKILKHASPHGAGKPNGSSLGLNGGKPTGSALASIRYNDRLETASQASAASSALESMEAEERDLREKLIVLEEQKFIVGEMLADARRRRRFEEMGTLGANVDDLSKEIDTINGRLERLDFASLYREGVGGASSPLPPVGG